MGGGHFGTVPIQITVFAPQARNVSPKQGFSLKYKVTGQVPLKCVSGPVPLQNTA